MARDARTVRLLRDLARAYDQTAWHGPNLRGSLRGVSAEMAAWRPGVGRNNIWELAVHAAYWKYRVCRSIDAGEASSFGVKGSNFPPRPEGAVSEEAWRADREFLDSWHRRLVGMVEGLPARRLGETAGKSPWTLEDRVTGVAHHDLYHAGQIRLLRRLWEDDHG